MTTFTPQGLILTPPQYKPEDYIVLLQLQRIEAYIHQATEEVPTNHYAWLSELSDFE